MIAQYPSGSKLPYDSANDPPIRPAQEGTLPVFTVPRERQSDAPRRARVLVFEDPRSRALLERLRLIAPSEANALIVGETGTGKEIIANHLHALSPRAQGPFVAVNCGAFSENLVETELFGHERGAFTGAISSKPGWFEAAHTGTLFLDEISDLPLALQVKLLRVLQERQVVRVGSRKPIDIDVRVVAATNEHLENAVNSGRFREDLYYRLNVASLNLAPLRERPGDIPPLVGHFLKTYTERLGLKGIRISSDAMETLVQGHTWPGNIRELENVIHHALLVRRDDTIRPEDLNLSSRRPRVNSREDIRRSAEPLPPVNPEEALKNAIVQLLERGQDGLYEKIEACVMRTAYDYCHRNQLETARLLGISRNIVRAKLLNHGELKSKKKGSDAPTQPE
ncbi:MAG: sigma-54-dependent Fis family transcriptional regulator [Verrucomicrobia bacterium]|nr:sigma-54-dependent Fis family transcriptional regulator [Verrucomicrobiota bacterium]